MPVTLDPKLYQLMAERVQDYAIFLLDTEGRVMSWNAGAAQIKQYTAEEIIGRHFSVFYPPETAATGAPPAAAPRPRPPPPPEQDAASVALQQGCRGQ